MVRQATRTRSSPGVGRGMALGWWWRADRSSVREEAGHGTTTQIVGAGAGRLSRYRVCAGAGADADAGPVGSPIFFAVLVTTAPVALAPRSMALLAAFAPRLTALSVRAATPEAALAADWAASTGPANAVCDHSAAAIGRMANRSVAFTGVRPVAQDTKMIATPRGPAGGPALDSAVPSSSHERRRQSGRHLHLRSAPEVLELVALYYPADRIPVKTRHLVKGLFDEGRI